MLALPWSLATFTLTATIAWFQRAAVLELWLAPWSEFYEQFGWARPAFALSTRAEVSLVVFTAVLVTLPVLHAEGWLALFRAPHRRRARRLTIPFVMVSCGAWWLALVCTQKIGLAAYSSLLRF